MLDNNEIARREYLDALVSGAVTYGFWNALDTATGKSYDLGFRPDRADEEVLSYLEDNYPAEQVERMDAEEKNLLLDFRYVEGEQLQENDLEVLNAVLEDAGLNPAIIEHEIRLSEQEYSKYGFLDVDLLGHEDSLWADETEDIMKQNAIQMYFVPGKRNDPNSGELKTFDDREKPVWRDGLTVPPASPRSAVCFDPPYRQEGVLHEIGHALGLGHSEDESNIMHPSISLEMDLEFTDPQAEKMKNLL